MLLPLVRFLVPGEVAEATARIWFKAGWKRFRHRDFRQAICDLERAARLNPKHDTVNYYLGSALEAAGFRWNARLYFVRQLRLDDRLHGRASPEYPVSLHNLGVNAMWRKEKRQALKWISESAQISRNAVETGDPERTLQTASAFGLFSKLKTLATCQYDLACHADAASTVREACRLETGPDNVKALAELMHIASKLGMAGALSLDEPDIARKINELLRRMQWAPASLPQDVLRNPEKAWGILVSVRREAAKIVVSNNPLVW